jgi:hypothetical protein
MIAALVWGAPRRSGPVWIGLAASLKVVPLAYALVYAGKRQWTRAGLAFAITATLWAPALLYSLQGFPTEPGESLSLLSIAGPIPWALLAALCAVTAIGFARTRFAWVAASTAVIAAIPRLALYDLTYLLVGAERRPE